MAKPSNTSKPKSTTKTKAAAKQPSSHDHPPYFQMISEAITALKERGGSSQQAIAKFLEEKYKTKLPHNFKKMLSVQLKRFAKSEKLTKIKNSFKITVGSVKPKATGAKVASKKSGDGKKKKTTTTPKKMKRLSKVVTPKKVSTPKKKVPKSIKATKPVSKKTKA